MQNVSSVTHAWIGRVGYPSLWHTALHIYSLRGILEPRDENKGRKHNAHDRRKANRENVHGCRNSQDVPQGWGYSQAVDTERAIGGNPSRWAILAHQRKCIANVSQQDQKYVVCSDLSRVFSWQNAPALSSPIAICTACPAFWQRRADVLQRFVAIVAENSGICNGKRAKKFIIL